SEQLRYLGHKVIESDGGHQALKLYKEQILDLIITDCNMPDMDGYELTRQIRRYELEYNHSPIYIIGYTANAQKEIISDCIESGMNDCLFKPITIDDLNMVLTKSPIENINSKERKINKVILFDINVIKNLTGNNTTLINNIFDKVITENKKDITNLQQALNAGKIQECQSLAHKMKSGANIIGCNMITDQCQKIEESESINEAESLIIILSEMIQQLEDNIRDYQTNEPS
ncbi:response regulator, partial [Vibrio sp. V28_P6S34P95]|uniref:response regulator n=2 Tax=unclassified Vibrio TaxID=2614977 RepID=UPI00137232D4